MVLERLIKNSRNVGSAEFWEAYRESALTRNATHCGASGHVAALANAADSGVWCSASHFITAKWGEYPIEKRAYLLVPLRAKRSRSWRLSLTAFSKLRETCSSCCGSGEWTRVITVRLSEEMQKLDINDTVRLSKDSQLWRVVNTINGNKADIQRLNDYDLQIVTVTLDDTQVVRRFHSPNSLA